MARDFAPARLDAAVLLALSMLTAAPPAGAQVQLETRVGFANTLRLGRWGPLELSFYNAGGARRGEAFARIRRGAAAREFEFVQRVEVPHQGRRSVQFVLPLLGTDHPLVVGMRGEDGRPVVEQTLSLAGYRATEALVLALTRDVDLEFLPSLQRRKTTVAYVRPDQLPMHWAGLDGVRGVIVHGVSLSELERARYDALREWVQAGGLLVFSAGGPYSVLQGPRERELLPVRVKGLTRARRLPNLPNLPGTPLPQGEWSLVDSVAERGEVLASAGDKPLIARRDLGLGSVYFLAIDYAAPRLSSWPGNSALWELLLPAEKESLHVEALAGELDMEAVHHPMAALLRQPLLRFPSRALVAAFVILYALFIAGALQAIREGWARGLAGWVILGLVIAGGSLGAWLWLREPLLRADGAVLALKTQRVHAGEEQGRLWEHAGLFSARGGSANLVIANPSTIVRAFTQFGGEESLRDGGPIRIHREADALYWRNLRLPRYSAAMLTVEAIGPAPVAVQVTRQGRVTALTLENLGKLPVVGSLVLQRGVLYEMGALRPGETREEDFFDLAGRPSQSTMPVADLVKGHVPAQLGELGAEVPRELVRRYFRTRVLADIGDRIIWLGWIPGEHPGLRLERGEQHEVSLTFVVSEVEL